LGQIPNPQSPIPNPQSPFVRILLKQIYYIYYYNMLKNYLNKNN